jgi:hypothetical protein
MSMKLRVFTARGSNWSWNLDIEPLQREINEWFAANPDIEVHEIKHDFAVTMFTPAVAYVWIYYR